MSVSAREKLPAFFLLSFLIGIPRLFTLTVSDSLFLSHYPAAQIPLAYLGRAVLIPILGLLLFQAERYLSNRRVLSGLLVLLSLVLVGFTTLIHQTDWTWPYLALLIWVSAEWTLSGMVFWNTANRHFTLREGKRAFGIISTGEVVAAILGGFLVPVLLKVLSPVDLLLLSVGGHLLALVLLHAIGEPKLAASEAARTRNRTRERRLGVADLFRSPYLLGLFGLTSLDFLLHYFTDAAFFLQVQLRFPDNNGLTAFLGAFLGALGVATLIFKLFLTPPLIQRLGLGWALALGPAVVALMGAAVFVAAAFPAGAPWVLPLLVEAKFIQMLVSEALFSPVYYLLFQPLPPRERTRIQNFAEAVPGRVIGGIGGLVLLWITGLGGPVIAWLGLGIAGLALLWWLLTRRTTREYWRVLQGNTEARSLPGLPTPAGLDYRPPSGFDEAFDRLMLWTRLSLAWTLDERKAGAPWMALVLKEEMDQGVGQVLEILQKEIPAEPLGGIREALASDSPALRSYALESLENLLDPERRDKLIPLLEWGATGPKVLERRSFRRLVHEAPPGVFRPLFPSLAEGQGDDDLTFLKSISLFREVPYWFLPLVQASSAEQPFQLGTVILHQGDSGDTLYLVRRGQVRVHDEVKTLAVIGPGGLFGEYAVFDPSPRTATVTGLEEGSILCLEGSTLFPLLQDHVPVLAGVVKILCLRLDEKPHWKVASQPSSSPLSSPRDLTVFAGLEPQALQALERWGTVERLEVGDLWTSPGDPPPGLTFVLSGALVWESVRFGPGTCVDDVAPLARRPCRGTCQAAEPSEVFVVDPELFLQSLALRPAALRDYLRGLVRRLKAAHDL